MTAGSSKALTVLLGAPIPAAAAAVMAPEADTGRFVNVGSSMPAGEWLSKLLWE
jgi:molybdopterin biosynthesis enzyme